MIAQSESPGFLKARPLEGRRVLVIEDEYFLDDDIVGALTALGARIVGPYGDFEEAAQIVDRDVAIDAAVMDVNLRDQMVFPLARLLRSRQVPLVFTTGYDKSTIAPEFRDVRLWSKPLDVHAMARELAGMINAK
jgi:CheY-like chemotaxis protein